MRRRPLYLILLMLQMIVIHSCGNRQSSGVERSVLVIHSWDSIVDREDVFNELMTEAFTKEGINARIHHFYLKAPHEDYRNNLEAFKASLADSIASAKPEVVLCNDDPAYYMTLNRFLYDSVFTSLPIVFAGVNVVYIDSMANYPRITGYEDAIDLVRNIDICNEFDDKTSITIQLDSNGYQDSLRISLFNQLADSSRFYINTGALRNLDADYLQRHYPRRRIITFASVADPMLNALPGETEEEAEQVLSKIMHTATQVTHLQVKFDSYANSLINSAREPQFTCIREQYNMGSDNPLFLGGFFTTLETQINDQVAYAARILRGARPDQLGIVRHAPTYNLDYKAMVRMGIADRCEELRKRFDIANVPSSISHPWERSLILLFIVFIGALVSWSIIILLRRWNLTGTQGVINDLLYEEKMHNLLFTDPHNTLWTISHGNIQVSAQFAQAYNMPTNVITFEQLKSMVHPDTMSSYYILRDFKKYRGRQRFRIKMTASQGLNWIWAELTYFATDETAMRDEIHGILLNVDEMQEIEQTLLKAQHRASEVSLKENFLANISHDLRTPLNAITGFSMLLTNKDMSFEPGERQEYGAIIRQNTEMILRMIDSVVEKAMVESDDFQLIQKPVSVRELVHEAYMTNKVIAPKHLSFLEFQDVDDVVVNIDRVRTIQVINNFLSNSFKFTAAGSVTIGWHHVLDDVVEIYVADTGIGIDETHQQHVFDRYVKENETDCGTGLGLNISKTIIEKQDGTIGVSSTLGKGSRFFFQLKRYVQMLLLVLSFAFTAGTFQSCQINDGGNRKMSRVMVIHGYDQGITHYRAFDNAINETLFANGIAPDICNVYLGINSTQDSGLDRMKTIADSLNRIGWYPDLVLVEGDRPYKELMNHPLSNYFASGDTIPIIFGALHHPDWERLRDFPNAVAFYDPIDYTTNIDLAVELGHKTIVEAELDYFSQDSLIRQELRQAISRPPYVDNTDYHLFRAPDAEETHTAWADSVVVITFSMASPASNGLETDTREVKLSNSRKALMYSNQFPQISFKYDTYSTLIVNASGRPQFTAVKAGFANAKASFLAGYFADYRTVGTDIAHAGARKLHNTPTAELNGRQHEKAYYMDYHAMERLGLKYHDYAGRFHIVNAPERYAKPFQWWIHRILLALFYVLVFVIWGGLILWLRERGEEDLLAQVKQNAENRSLAVRGADSRSLRSEEELKGILARVHPNKNEDVLAIKAALANEGSHGFELYADVDGDGIYHWWQLRFVVLFTGGRKHFDGLIINIDENKQYEQDLQTALRLAEEAQQKENFLTTISHEIRTPLNAVVGFSDVVASLPEGCLSEDELAEIADHISENNARLAGMIEDILMFSRIESGRLQYVNSEFYVSDLIDELQKDWTPRMRDGVNFIVTSFRHYIYVDSDRTRLKYILDHFISNAIKFTNEGTIVLSPVYHYNSNEVEIMVSDTGVGIPLEKQQAVFDLFWKDDEFVPGLGIGLNISRRLAEGLGCRIVLESKEGFGSRISIFVKAELRKDK